MNMDCRKHRCRAIGVPCTHKREELRAFAVWYAGYCEEACRLVREFVAQLKEIPDGCAELFPFELIDELEEEYEI